MNIPLTLVPYVNMLILLFIVLSMFLGYQRGILYQIFSLLGVLTAILVSWFFAPVVAEQVQVYPVEWCPFDYTNFADVFYDKMNTLVWYIILFVAVAVLFMLLKPLAKVIQKIPVLGKVNQVLGMFFGILPALVLILFITYFLSTPIVKNGKDVINQTWLGSIRNATTNVITILEEPYNMNEAIQKLVSDPMSLTEEDTKMVFEWLISEHEDSEEIQDFVNEHSVHQIEK